MLDLRRVDISKAKADEVRPGGLSVDFDTYGYTIPLPGDVVMMVNGDDETPGRVYAANYGQKVVYLEPDPEQQV